MEGGGTKGGRNHGGLLIVVLMKAAIDYLSIQQLGPSYCILISSFMHHIQLIVRKVVNQTPGGSLWELSLACFVHEFIKHMWRLGPTCARSQHVCVQCYWVSWGNPNLQKLHFEELGRKEK